MSGSGAELRPRGHADAASAHGAGSPGVARPGRRAPSRRADRLDGWGCAPPGPGNAVSLADTPVFDALWARTRTRTLDASGEAVGLPDGQMGNSEVGHLNLGAGRVVKQDLARIDDAIADGTFFENRVLAQAMRQAAGRGGRLHLIGLVSDGGVHSSWATSRRDRAGRARGRPRRRRARLHRRPRHAAAARPGYLAEVAGRRMDAPASAATASVSGRYYAMDRDRAGTAPSSPTTRSSTARAHAADAAGGRAGRLRARRDRRVHPPTVVGAERDARVRTATSASSSTSAPTAPASSRAPRRAGLRRVRPRRRARRPSTSSR